MGLCRFWVYVIAGTTGVDGLNGWPIWSGAALAFYLVGVSYLAKLENSRAPVSQWPLFLLAAPLLLAQLMNTGGALKPAMLVSVALTLWVAFSLRTHFLPGEFNPGGAVSGLTAGIVLVDWLAVAPQCPPELSAAFLFLFVSTIILQRLIPAH
jgi:4-hydroxybenzoate polyprenyltransferase